jgi:hypothetical protein
MEIQIVPRLAKKNQGLSHHSLVPPLSGPFRESKARFTAAILAAYSNWMKGIRRINVSVEILPPLLLTTMGNNLG